MVESRRRGRKGGAAHKPRIVGIGASAGGVRALQALFSALPDDAGGAYVVILHLAPESRSELAKVLASRTAMPVVSVDGPMPLEPDHVYVIPPDRALQITDDSIDAVAFTEPRGLRTPIDLLNEELETVNNELKVKLEGVSRANSDLQDLMDATDVATLFLDMGLRIKRFTPRLTDLFNVTASDKGRPITDFTHQLQFDDLPGEATSVLRNLAPVEREVASRSGRRYLMRLRPYRTVDDRIDGVVATFVDITERSRIEEALRKSEEQLRQETRLVELSHAPIFVWDLDGGILQWNRGSEQLYGYPRDVAIGQRKDVLLRTEAPGGFDTVINALTSQGRWSGELVQVARDGRRLTVQSELELVVIGERRLVLESTRDITDRKMWQERQELMVRELTHRIKNTLTVVQAIAAQSIRGADSAEVFTERFEGRIAALAASHRLLSDPWRGADLEELAREQLTAYAEGQRDGLDSERLRLSGERISLSPDLAVPVGLVLHELATNAVKYGAWSSSKGVVELTWRRTSRQGSDDLSIAWRERGGPPVQNPERSGFGSRLIESGIPRARVRRDFKAEGMECLIDIPLTPESLRE